MQIEIALAVQSGVAEGPFWDAEAARSGGSTSRARRSCAGDPGARRRSAGRCPTSPRPWCCAAARARCVALRDGLYFMDLESGRLDVLLSARARAAGEPHQRRQVRCERPLLARHDAEQSAAGRLGADDDGQHGCPLLRAGGRHQHARARRDRPLQHARLDRRTAAPSISATRRPNVIWAFDCDPETGRLANRRVFSDEKLPGFCDGSAIDAQGYLWNARFAGGCRGPLRARRPGRADHRTAGHQPHVLLLRRPRPCDPLRHLGTLRPERGAAPAEPAGGCAPRAAPGRRRHALASVRGLRRPGPIASGADRERR